MVYINFLAAAGKVNNKKTGELSDLYKNLFTPAGVTFSIWSVIYLGLIAFCILQFFDYGEDWVDIVEWYFLPTCIFNILWIYMWHYLHIYISVIVMLLLLTSLIFLVIPFTEKDISLPKIVFGIYLGWICIATIANIAAALVNAKWNGFGISDVVWTIIVIIIGAAITCVSVWKLQNPFLSISVVWAFIGIIIKRSQDQIYSSNINTPIIITSIICSLVVIGFTIFIHFFKNYKL